MTEAPENSTPSIRHGLRDPAHIAALLLSLCLAAIMLGPAIRGPGSHIVGNWNHPDCLGNHWLMVWVAERVLSLESLLHNSHYYAPFGDAPWLAGNGSEGFLYAPFHAIWGWPTGANLYLLFICCLNGLAAYALGRVLGAGRWGSLLLLSAISCSPYVTQELSSGRFSQANLGFFLLSLALFFSLLEQPTRKKAWALAISGALCCLFYFYYAFFLLLIGLCVLIARRLGREAIPREFWWACLIGIVLLLPLFWIFFSNWEQIPGTGEGVFPHPESRIHATGLSPGNLLSGHGRLVAMSQPLPILLLAVLGLLRPGSKKQARQRRILFVLALLGWWLCLGPKGGLYTLIYGLHPALERFWWPYRHALLLSVFLAALAALAIPRAWEKKAWPAILLAICLPLSLKGQGLMNHARTSAIELPPRIYAELGKQEGELLLQTPLNPKVSAVQTPLIYQLFHHKKMINGHAPWVDRVRPPAWDEMIEQNSFMAALVSYEAAEISGEVQFEGGDLQALIDEGLRHIVVDQELYLLKLRPLVTGTRSALQHLFGAPVLSKKRTWIYDTRNWTGESTLVLPKWDWPRTLHHSKDGQAIFGRRPPSALFPPQGPKNHP